MNNNLQESILVKILRDKGLLELNPTARYIKYEGNGEITYYSSIGCIITTPVPPQKVALWYKGLDNESSLP